MTAPEQLSGAARSRAVAELVAIRLRLEQGDFRVGDRFVITLRQDGVLSDTASVRDSLNVTITGLPDISLRGVLRSELDERLSAHVAKFLKNASVRSSALTRIAILGAVRSPGYYYVPPDRPISDVLMLAGGPAATANLNEVEISRAGATFLRAKDSRRAVKDGRTIEQLDVQSGDEVRIATVRKIEWRLIVQSLLFLSSMFFAVIQFLQWYYNRLDG
ncbi:MAG: SLBB domain-containing protein [Gemmatimonadota bacterium]|nr:SLBB domain-containing protein [Gemmatimonadota bacterium]